MSFDEVVRPLDFWLGFLIPLLPYMGWLRDCQLPVPL
eukprot:SAG11_NODE_35412_length_266_cov_1.826347_1_plen_36_part_10